MADRITGRLKTRLLNQAGTRWTWGHEGQPRRAQPRSVCLGSWRGHHHHFLQNSVAARLAARPSVPPLSSLDCGLPLCPCTSCSIVRNEHEASDCQVQIWWPHAYFEERRKVLSPICLPLWGSHFIFLPTRLKWWEISLKLWNMFADPQKIKANFHCTEMLMVTVMIICLHAGVLWGLSW